MVGISNQSVPEMAIETMARTMVISLEHGLEMNAILIWANYKIFH